MPLRKATITFVTTFTLLLGAMIGMSSLVDGEVEAARQSGGYGVAQIL